MSTSKSFSRIVANMSAVFALLLFVGAFALTNLTSGKVEEVEMIPDPVNVLATGTIDRQDVEKMGDLPQQPEVTVWSQVVPQDPDEYTGWQDADGVPEESVSEYTQADSSAKMVGK